MNDILPEVDDLIRLAKDDPEALEQLRSKLCRQLIENAPEKYQRRLNGLQFQIDMERRRSKNELHCCIKISEMMLESYQNLQKALSELKHETAGREKDFNHPQTTSNNHIDKSADIIDFCAVVQE